MRALASSVEQGFRRNIAMGALDKLINLLEEVKSTNPDFSSKAEKALDALINEEEEVEEPEAAEEPFDDSYIEIEQEHLLKVIEHHNITTQLVTKLGLVVQNYEVDKELILEQMEKVQISLKSLMEEMKKNYKLDKNSDYDFLFPEDNERNTESAAFLKKE